LHFAAAGDAIETTMRSTTMTDNTENDAKVPADDQRDQNADAGGTPKLNRVTINNTTKPGTGFAIVRCVALSKEKSSE